MCSSLAYWHVSSYTILHTKNCYTNILLCSICPKLRSKLHRYTRQIIPCNVCESSECHILVAVVPKFCCCFMTSDFINRYNTSSKVHFNLDIRIMPILAVSFSLEDAIAKIRNILIQIQLVLYLITLPPWSGKTGHEEFCGKSIPFLIQNSKPMYIYLSIWCFQNIRNNFFFIYRAYIYIKTQNVHLKNRKKHPNEWGSHPPTYLSWNVVNFCDGP